MVHKPPCALPIPAVRVTRFRHTRFLQWFEIVTTTCLQIGTEDRFSTHHIYNNAPICPASRSTQIASMRNQVIVNGADLQNSRLSATSTWYGQPWFSALYDYNAWRTLISYGYASTVASSTINHPIIHATQAKLTIRLLQHQPRIERRWSQIHPHSW